MNRGFFELEALVRKEALGLKNVSWPPMGSNYPGFRVGFAGLAGSGKTSLIRALLGQQVDSILTPYIHYTRTITPTEYRYGQDLKLFVKRTKDDSWLTVHTNRLPIDLAGYLRQVGCDFNAVTLELPIPILREWNAVFVDLPPIGIEPHMDALARHELAQCDAVVWIMDSRRWGLGDHEIKMLETDLRFLPMVFLSNIREDDLIPTGVPVEAKDVPFIGPKFPMVFPVISLECRHESSPERQLILDILGILRRRQLEQSQGAIFNKHSVEKLCLAIAEAEECRLRSLLRRLDGGSPLDVLKVLDGIQGLQKYLKEKVHISLTNLTNIQEELITYEKFTIEDEYQAIVSRAEKLSQTYNIRAGAKTKNHFAGYKPTEDRFGEVFARPRDELRGFIGNILQVSDDLMLGDHDIRVLKSLDSEICDGRIEIAMLGMFSSGKSALVNRLLGATINDQESELLPTKPTVTTATINRLEWADTRQLNGVDWLEETELVFLEDQPDVGIRVRVREQEIKAFEQWAKTGAICFAECDIQEFEPQNKKVSVKGSELFDNLLRVVRKAGGKFTLYMNRRPELRLAGRVVIHKFHGNRPALTKGMPLKDAFRLAERPDVALQIQMLHIGTPHPLLKHGAIIDTPGTDSHILHHRELSRSLIKKRRVAVIYCFLSTQPGGIEDKNNIQILIDAGTETMRRVFFVITRKGDIQKEECEELRAHIQSRLESLEIPMQGIHFIELLKFPDPEFEDFSNQVSEFIKSEHKPQLTIWSMRAQDLLKQAGVNAATNLADLELEEKDRASKKEELERILGRVKQIAKDLSQSKEWGADYLRRRTDWEITQACEEISEKISALQNHHDFDEFNSWLDKKEDDLNESILKALRKNINVMQSKLKSELAEIRAAKPVDFYFEDDNFFDLSSVVTKASNINFSIWDAILDGFSYKPQVINARTYISQRWSYAINKGKATCKDLVEKAIVHCKDEVGRAEDQVKGELESVRPCDLLELEQRRKLLIKTIKCANDWVRRFNDWEKKNVKYK